MRVLALLLLLTGCSSVGFRTPVQGSETERGHALVVAAWDRHGVRDFYRRPQRFSGRRLLWLPSRAWNRMTPEQRGLVTRYVESASSGAAGIGFGRVVQGDILADRVVPQQDLPGLCDETIAEGSGAAQPSR